MHRPGRPSRCCSPSGQKKERPSPAGGTDGKLAEEVQPIGVRVDGSNPGGADDVGSAGRPADECIRGRRRSAYPEGLARSASSSSGCAPRRSSESKPRRPALRTQLLRTFSFGFLSLFLIIQHIWAWTKISRLGYCNMSAAHVTCVYVHGADVAVRNAAAHRFCTVKTDPSDVHHWPPGGRAAYTSIGAPPMIMSSASSAVKRPSWYRTTWRAIHSISSSSWALDGRLSTGCSTTWSCHPCVIVSALLLLVVGQLLRPPILLGSRCHRRSPG